MQAVLLAAGQSSRFFPYNTKHKCLVKILGEPLIVYTIRAVKRAGINDIILIVPNEHDFQDVLGNGKKFGVKISYSMQPRPTGAGEMILSSSKLIKSDFFLINSNHVEFDTLKKIIDGKRKTNNEAVLLATQGVAGKKYGALKVEGDKVLAVREKPKNDRTFSNLRVIGVYFLNQEFVKILKKVKKEHYSLERALDVYAKKGKVRISISREQVYSLKYPWDLLEVKNYLLAKIKRNISKKAYVAKSAQIDGDVVIEENVHVLENAVIKGPAYIGQGAFIGSNSLIRNSSDIEENAKIGAYMEVKNSLIGENSSTHSGFIGDSIIGSSTKIGALFGTANVRLDRKNVTTTIKGEKVDTQLRSLGAIIGSNTTVGERVSTMPGVVIGNNVKVGPSTTVMKNIDSNATYYTKFSEIIEKNSGLKISVKPAPKIK